MNIEEYNNLKRQVGHLIEFILWLKNDYHAADWQLNLKLDALLRELEK